MMPNIEEDVPLPKNAKDAMPELGMEEELQVRVETVKTIADLKGEPIPDASPKEQQQAVDFVKKVMTDPNFKPEYGNYTDPTMAFCAGMVAQTQVLLAKELATEVTHKVESMEEVEKELLTMLNDFKQKGLMKEPAQTIDAEVIEDKVEENTDGTDS